MSTRHPINVGRWRLRTLIALCASAAITPHVHAQQAGADSMMEEVVVTGSRLQRADYTTAPQPISVISAEDLSNSGSVDIGEVLNENPALLSSVTSTNSLDGQAANVGRASNQGGSALNLRGLGTGRTLTLVNGRRHVSGIEGTSSVDVSTIPSALIERVEVLTGGASAVYGADAVTGVVNFVLRNDFEGAEIDFRPGISERGDAATGSLRALFGRNFAENRGNVSLALQHDYSDGLRAGDRRFLSDGGRLGNDVNPDLRFQRGDINPNDTPNFAQYYNFDNTGLFPWGLRIPTASSFESSFQSEFGEAPNLTPAELALIERSATATPRALLPGRTFNITSPYGVVAIGDFGSAEFPLGSEPDLDGDGTPDCLQSFTGYNSSLGGAASFGAAGGCWFIDADGNLVPYVDGLVAGNFNQFGAEQSYIAPNRPYVIPKDQKYSVNLNAFYELTDRAELFVESKYSFHEVTFGGGGHMATDLLYGSPENPFLPEPLRPFANNSGVSFVGPGGLYISRDSDDWGRSESTNRRHTYRLVTGLRGTMDVMGGMDYEIAANYGRFERSYRSPETRITDRFFAAIDVVTDPSTGQPVCRSDLDPTAYPYTTPFNFPAYLGGRAYSPFFTFQPGDGQCQPANIWGGEGAISQEAIDFFTYVREVDETIEQSVISGYVAGDTRDFFSLPGGAIAFAFGGEWREERSSQSFDDYDRGILPVSGVTVDGTPFQAGDWVGDVSNASSLGASANARLLNTSASYDVWDVFAEFEFPILAGIPFAEELTVNAAGRRADYSTFGSTDTWGTGVVWAPVDDVRLRANYSQAVRVPNLFELFSPEQGQNFRPRDPCDVSQINSAPDPAVRQANCVAHLQSFNVSQSNIFDSQGNYAFVDPLSAGFAGVTGGNRNLEPEEATTQTFGVVLQPRWVPGLALSVDYWDIEIDGAINSISAQNTVESCYDSPSIDNPFCDLFLRNPEPTSAQSGGFTFLRQTQLNFGQALARGVDANVGYSFNINEYRIRLTAAASKQLKLTFIEPTNPGQEPTVNEDIGALRRPEWSGQFSVNVANGPYSASWRGQYLGAQTMSGRPSVALNNFGDRAYTGDFWSHNVSANYQFSEAMRFYGGIGNVTNAKPFPTERAYPVSPVGRNYYVGLNWQF